MVDWNEFYQEPVSLNRIVEVVEGQKVFIEKIRKYSGAGSLLETGIGSGIFSVYLSCLGYRVAGVEINPDIVKRVAAFNDGAGFWGSRARLVMGNMFALPFKAGTFDLCFHQGVFEHFENEEISRALDEQLRVSRVVVFSVPSHRYPTKDFGNERLLSVSAWRTLLGSFRIMEEFGYNFGVSRIIHRLQGPIAQKVLRAISCDDLVCGREIGFVVGRRR